jgi:hypothetical protein
MLRQAVESNPWTAGQLPPPNHHAENGVTAGYDRHSYEAEKREALVRWAGRLDEILDPSRNPGNVIRIA